MTASSTAGHFLDQMYRLWRNTIGQNRAYAREWIRDETPSRGKSSGEGLLLDVKFSFSHWTDEEKEEEWYSYIVEVLYVPAMNTGVFARLEDGQWKFLSSHDTCYRDSLNDWLFRQQMDHHNAKERSVPPAEFTWWPSVRSSKTVKVTWADDPEVTNGGRSINYHKKKILSVE